MTRRSSQIDPFNAGEPEMPWDEPGSVEPVDAEHACKLPEHGYEGPTKTPDGYDAPSEGDSSGSASDRMAPSGRVQRARDRSRARRSRANATGSGSSMPSGPARPRKRGWGCAGILILVVAINVLVPLLSFLPECSDDDVVDGDASTSWSDESDNDAGKQAVEELANATLAGMADEGSPARERIAQHFATAFQNNLRYRVEDFGIDPYAYADWALAGMGYDIYDVFAFDEDRDGIDGTGSAFFDATTHDTAGCSGAFFEQASAYLGERGLLGSDVAVPDDAQRAEMQAILTDAMNAYRDSYVTAETASLDLVRTDGTWSVTDESYDFCLDYLFKLY